jgi:U3 small nucleolar RNA-associated protein 22
LKFESSGKLPESLEAIQKIKAAMLVKIAEALEQSRQVLQSTIFFDHKALPIAQNITLDVLHSSGHAFKLMICYKREEMLLDKSLTINTNDKETLECKTSWLVEALGSYCKTFIYLRKHHDAITALQSRFPLFTYTVRLIKQWFSTHMLLSTHVSVELVELLALVVYFLPDYQQPPTTGSSGCVHFLRFLKCWD